MARRALLFDGNLFCRLVVYELVYGIEATDVAVVELSLHYSYVEWWSFVRRFLLFFDGWLMDFVILEANIYEVIYGVIYIC